MELRSLLSVEYQIRLFWVQPSLIDPLLCIQLNDLRN